MFILGERRPDQEGSGECAVHQTARPSLSPNDDIIGARHLVSPCLRLLVYQAAQVTHSE